MDDERAGDPGDETDKTGDEGEALYFDRSAPLPRSGHELKGRITVVEIICHQNPNEGATSIQSRFERRLETYEQPWIRSMPISGSWTPIKNCWIERCGMLEIKNETAASITVGICDGADTHEFAEVPPRESARFKPTSLSALRFKSEGGNSRVALSIFPA